MGYLCTYVCTPLPTAGPGDGFIFFRSNEPWVAHSIGRSTALHCNCTLLSRRLGKALRSAHTFRRLLGWEGLIGASSEVVPSKLPARDTRGLKGTGVVVGDRGLDLKSAVLGGRWYVYVLGEGRVLRRRCVGMDGGRVYLLVRGCGIVGRFRKEIPGFG